MQSKWAYAQSAALRSLVTANCCKAGVCVKILQGSVQRMSEQFCITFSPKTGAGGYPDTLNSEPGWPSAASDRISIGFRTHLGSVFEGVVVHFASFAALVLASILALCTCSFSKLSCWLKGWWGRAKRLELHVKIQPKTEKSSNESSN